MEISGWREINGVLIAPNETIAFGGSKFKGVMISKEGLIVTNGSAVVEMKDISEYFPSAGQISLEKVLEEGPGTGNEGNQKKSLSILKNRSGKYN